MLEDKAVADHKHIIIKGKCREYSVEREESYIFGTSLVLFRFYCLGGKTCLISGDAAKCFVERKRIDPIKKN